MVSGWVFGSDGFRIRSVLVLCVQCVHRLVADSARAPRYGRDTLWPVFPGDSLMQTHTHTHTGWTAVLKLTLSMNAFAIPQVRPRLLLSCEHIHTPPSAFPHPPL